MNSNIIFSSQIPHTLINKYEDGDTVLISAEVNDIAHVAATPSAMSQVIDFHKNELREEVIVLADTLDDVQAALDSRVDFEFNGEGTSLKGLSRKQIDLLKLSYANSADNDKVSYRYVMTSLREDGALTSPEEIAEAIGRTGASVSQNIISDVAIKHDNKVQKAVESSMSITRDKGLNIRKVDSKHDIDTSEILGGGVFINGTGTGFGKTEIADKILTTEGVRGAYIASTRSIILSNIPSATHYKSIPACQDGVDTLKVVMNSLKKPKVMEFFDSKPLDVVVLDEFTQTLRAIAYGDYKGAAEFNRVEIFYALVRIVANARVVYIADADANDDVIDFLRICGRLDNVTYYTNERKLDKTIILKPYETARAEAVQALKHGKIYLAADTKAMVEQVAAKEAKEGARNILGVSARNIASRQVGEIMKNPNAVNSFDGFAFTPAISSSFSITEDSFTHHIGLFSGVVTACDIIQMLRRNRIADCFTLGVQANNDILDDVYASLISKTDNNEFDRFAAKIEARDNLIRNNITLAAYHAAKLAGFNIEINKNEDEEAQKEASSYIGSAKQIEGNEYREELKKAIPADKKAQKDTTSDNETSDFFSLERASLENTIGKSDVSDDDIKNWKRGALAKNLHNLEIARAHAVDVNNKQRRENRKAAGRDRKDYASHSNAFKAIFTILGIDLKTLEGTYTAAETSKLQDYLYEQREAFNALDLDCYLKKGKGASFTRKANAILKEFGLAVESKTIRLQDGSTTKGYSIKAKSREAMLQYLHSRRMARTNSL